METHEVDQLIVVSKAQNRSRMSKRVALFDENGDPVDISRPEPLPALTSIIKEDLDHVHVRSAAATNVLAIAGMSAQYEVIDRPIIVEFGAAVIQHSVDGGHCALRLVNVDTGITLASMGGHVPKANGWIAPGQMSADLIVPGIYNVRLDTITTTTGTLTAFCAPFTTVGPMFLRGKYGDNELAVA